MSRISDLKAAYGRIEKRENKNKKRKTKKVVKKTVGNTRIIKFRKRNKCNK